MKKFSIVGLAAAVFVVGIVGGQWLGGKIRQSVRPMPNVPAAAQTPQQSQVANSAPRMARPPFTLPDMNGTMRSVDEWRGKVLVVNFWATWCPPCRREIPEFNRIREQYKSRNVEFIGIAWDNKAAVVEFLKSMPILYPVLVAEGEVGDKLSADYGNDDAALPYTVFIDRNGGIASIRSGAMSGTAVETTLQKLL